MRAGGGRRRSFRRALAAAGAGPQDAHTQAEHQPRAPRQVQQGPGQRPQQTEEEKEERTPISVALPPPPGADTVSFFPPSRAASGPSDRERAASDRDRDREREREMAKADVGAPLAVPKLLSSSSSSSSTSSSGSAAVLFSPGAHGAGSGGATSMGGSGASPESGASLGSGTGNGHGGATSAPSTSLASSRFLRKILLGIVVCCVLSLCVVSVLMFPDMSNGSGISGGAGTPSSSNPVNGEPTSDLSSSGGGVGGAVAAPVVQQRRFALQLLTSFDLNWHHYSQFLVPLHHRIREARVANAALHGGMGLVFDKNVDSIEAADEEESDDDRGNAFAAARAVGRSKRSQRRQQREATAGGAEPTQQTEDILYIILDDSHRGNVLTPMHRFLLATSLSSAIPPPLDVHGAPGEEDLSLMPKEIHYIIPHKSAIPNNAGGEAVITFYERQRKDQPCASASSPGLGEEHFVYRASQPMGDRFRVSACATAEQDTQERARQEAENPSPHTGAAESVDEDDGQSSAEDLSKGGGSGRWRWVKTAREAIFGKSGPPMSLTNDPNTREVTLSVPFLGAFGGKAFNRGTYFEAEGSDQELRDALSHMCGLRPQAPGAAQRSRKVALYQRNWNRKMEQADELMRKVKDLGIDGLTTRQIVHRENRGPCELVRELRDVWALITPHGFQTLLLFFMPRQSLVFEVFPYKYSKDNTHAYCALAAEYGVRYAHALSPPTDWTGRLFLAPLRYTTCHSYERCRFFARAQNVHVTPCAFDRLAHLLTHPEAAADEQNCPSLSVNEDWEGVDRKKTCHVPYRPPTQQRRRLLRMSRISID